MPAIVLQRAAVVAEDRLEVALGRLGVRGLDEIPDRHDQRRIRDDPRLAVDLLGELRERLQAVLRPRLRAPPRHSPLLRGALLPDRLLDGGDIEARVPHLHVRHRGEPPHRLAVLARDAQHGFSRCAFVKLRSRPQISKLVARRFRSHSNGPGSVSSKSLRSKTRSRSGDA